MSYKGISVKLYPTQNQIDHMRMNFNNCKFLWNQLLNMWNTRFNNNPDLPRFSAFDLIILLPTLKEEYPFLKESESSSFQVVCESLCEAFNCYYRNTHKYPKFKSKKYAKKSYTIKNNKNIKIEKSYLKIPKIGWVKAKWSDEINYDKIKRMTITETPSGKFKASLIVESENQTYTKTDKQIGLDLGLTDLLIGSNGYRIPSKMHNEYQEKLLYWQKIASRRQRIAKEKGIALEEAKNYQKAKRMVAKYHEKIQNSRNNYLHKVTTELVKEYDFIVIEDLSAHKLVTNNNDNENHKAKNRKITNQAFGKLIEMLEYKCKWHGKTLIKVETKYTSQDCSTCRERTGPINDLSIREWICDNCGAHHDRDINAAINILNKGIEQVM